MLAAYITAPISHSESRNRFILPSSPPSVAAVLSKTTMSCHSFQNSTAETAETTFRSWLASLTFKLNFAVREMHEAYQPIIDDGRGRFPEDLRVKAPRDARAAIAAAAEIKNTSHSEYVRQALLRCLEADGVKLRRGVVELAGEAV
jgi:hypothetical protein